MHKSLIWALIASLILLVVSSKHFITSPIFVGDRTALESPDCDMLLTTHYECKNGNEHHSSGGYRTYPPRPKPPPLFD